MDLPGCKKGNLEEDFLKIASMCGSDITDGTNVKCDICYEDGSESKGGYILFEKKGSLAAKLGPITYACTRCYEDFTCASTRKFKNLSYYQQKALKFGIGMNPEKFGELNKDRTFKENVIRYKQENSEDFGQPWKCRVELVDKDKEPEKNTGVAQGNLCRLCKGCSQSFEVKVLKNCSACKMAYYCSVKCQSSDWKKGHKTECIKSEVK